MTVARLWAHLRYYQSRHGWTLAGLSMLLAAGSLQLAVVSPMQERIDTRHASIAALRLQLSRQPPPQLSVADSAVKLLEALPAEADAPDTVARIHRLALKRGVRLESGEYRLLREAGGRLVELQITLPARADYLQLRGWLSDVLQAEPAAMLGELALRRDDVGSVALDARVRLSVFMRAS